MKQSTLLSCGLPIGCAVVVLLTKSVPLLPAVSFVKNNRRLPVSPLDSFVTVLLLCSKYQARLSSETVKLVPSIPAPPSHIDSAIIRGRHTFGPDGLID